MKLTLITTPFALAICTIPAFAGGAAPLPIAGAVGGPIGLGVAVAGYGVYWLYKKQQGK